MADSVRAFYDELAESYHLIYADWHGSMRRQAAALNTLTASNLGPGRHGRESAISYRQLAIGYRLSAIS